MKKYLYLTIFTALSAVILMNCEQHEMPRYANYSAYEFSQLDEDGGNWTPVLITSGSDIAIPQPASPESDEYAEELTEVRTIVSSITSGQKDAVKYWTNNPVIRWNEIALELAAKYNLIPGPNPDGTYTLPNPATPEGPHPFPFAHPAYTSRALAYLSVAQFDALIASWYYKYEYQRKNPSTYDNNIVSAYGNSQLPSYPADGAAVAIASRDILKAMFPLEKAFLDNKADEHLGSLIWSGSHVPSDVDAGKIIGAELARLALARASQDGMSKAQCPKPVSDSIAKSAQDRFGWHWVNQEKPQRPVGLAPLYCNVKMWSVPNVELVRPEAPPAIGSEEFNEAMKELQYHQDNMTEEKRKIANWWSDGLGSYTPPGHWNKFAKDFIIKYKLNPIRSARTFAYLNMAVMDAGIACWDAKYHFHYPRPVQASPGFKTILGTPNFPSYTSGHSTFSAAAATVLGHIFPAEKAQCEAWALEAAESRIYAGIHYRFDSEVGLIQGKEVGEYTLVILKNDGADSN